MTTVKSLFTKLEKLQTKYATSSNIVDNFPASKEWVKHYKQIPKIIEDIDDVKKAIEIRKVIEGI